MANLIIAKMSLSAPQSIVQNADVFVFLDAVDFDPYGCVNLSDSQIVAPAGVNWVRGAAQMEFAQNSAGTREMFISANMPAGDPADFEYALVLDFVRASTGRHVQNVCSHWHPCVPGDVFSFVVFQTTTAALNLLTATMSIEFRK